MSEYFDDSVFEESIRNAQIQADSRQYGKLMVTDRCIPVFTKRQVPNAVKSKEAGRPIYDERDYIEIITPGEKDRFVGPVREDHKRRFAEQWESYEKGEKPDLMGTPITEWQGISRTRAAELRASKIWTVEILAELPDSSADQVGPNFFELRSQAKRFVEGVQEALENEKRNANLESKLAERDALIAEMGSRIEDLEAKLGTDIEVVTSDNANANQDKPKRSRANRSKSTS